MSSSSSSLSPKAPPRKEVTFASWSNLILVPEKTKFVDTTAKLYYCKDDYERFQKDMIQDVRRMSSLIATTPAHLISREELQDCLGIEPFLSHDALRALEAKKRAHINTIVTGQHLFNKTDLATIASKSSAWAVEASRNRASFGIQE